MIQAASHFIVDAHSLCTDGFVDFVAATDGQRSPTRITFNRLSQIICSRFGRRTSARSRRSRNGIGNFVTGTIDQRPVGILGPVGQPYNAICDTGSSIR